MSTLEQHNEKLKKIGAELSHTGSTYICSPAPENTDIDYLVFCKTGQVFNDVFAYLTGEHFNLDCGDHYQNQANNTFFSLSQKPINYIVTKNYAFAENHKIATEVCKSLNVLDKKMRLIVFQAILYGKTPINET